MKMNWKPCLVNLILIGIVETIVVSVAYAICYKPPYLENAFPKKSESMAIKYETGAVVSYWCYPGHRKISGQGKSRCQESGKWSIPDIECQEIECPVPQEVRNSERNIQSRLIGGNVIYKCLKGFRHHSGNLERRCQQDETWSGIPPICTAVQCPFPQEVPNSERYVQSTEYGGKVNYACHQGFRHNLGDLERRCQLDGTWSGIPPVCNDIKCIEGYLSKYPDVEQCEVLSALEPGDEARCTCKHRKGEVIIKCLHNGEWEDPCKGVECPVPQEVPNSERYVQSRQYRGKVIYACYQGFRHHLGDLEQQCQLDGTWSGIPPVCEAEVPEEKPALLERIGNFFKRSRNAVCNLFVDNC